MKPTLKKMKLNRETLRELVPGELAGAGRGLETWTTCYPATFAPTCYRTCQTGESCGDLCS